MRLLLGTLRSMNAGMNVAPVSVHKLNNRTQFILLSTHTDVVFHVLGVVLTPGALQAKTIPLAQSPQRHGKTAVAGIAACFAHCIAFSCGVHRGAQRRKERMYPRVTRTSECEVRGIQRGTTNTSMKHDT